MADSILAALRRAGMIMAIIAGGLVVAGVSQAQSCAPAAAAPTSGQAA